MEYIHRLQLQCDMHLCSGAYLHNVKYMYTIACSDIVYCIYCLLCAHEVISICWISLAFEVHICCWYMHVYNMEKNIQFGVFDFHVQ